MGEDGGLERFGDEGCLGVVGEARVKERETEPPRGRRRIQGRCMELTVTKRD